MTTDIVNRRGMRVTLLLVVVLLSASFVNRGQSAESVRYRFVEKLVFENRGSDPIALSESDRAVSFFQNNSRQTVILVVVDPPMERSFNDSDGNLYGLVRSPATLSGGSNLSISVVYEITSMGHSGPELRRDLAEDLSKINRSELISEYCAGSGTLLTEDPKIRAKAFEIKGNRTKVLDIVEAFIVFFRANVTYDSGSEQPKYPNETLGSLSGDCDDQSILFITMCRILGIPAYLQVGCVLKEDLNSDEMVWDGHVRLHTEGVGWHGWSMVYIPPWGWLPVDLTYVTDRSGTIPEIEHPGIYQEYIVLDQNVSKYDYVGESRDTRQMVLNSALYIYLEEKAVKMSPETPPGPWSLVLQVVAAFSIVFVFLYTWRRSRAG